jgi:NTP pyrophosphatase (non-canonical NTP hydrolase)
MLAMIIEDKLETYSIDQWEAEFAEIYGDVDQKRRPVEIWLLLVEDSSRVAEGIRKEKYAEAISALAHVFCWTCSFIWRCRHDSDLGIEIKNPTSNILWNKYPGKCCLCGNSICSCSVNRWENEELSEREKREKLKRLEADLRRSRRAIKKKPPSLDGFTDMLRRIYRGAHYSLPIEAIAFHFMEEVGEVSTCIRKLKEREPNLSRNKSDKLIKELEDELADVLSWIMSLIAKLDFILGAGRVYEHMRKSESRSEARYHQTVNLKLSRLLWQEFRNPARKILSCSTCYRRPCTCGKPLLEK